MLVALGVPFAGVRWWWAKTPTRRHLLAPQGGPARAALWWVACRYGGGVTGLHRCTQLQGTWQAEWVSAPRFLCLFPCGCGEVH